MSAPTDLANLALKRMARYLRSRPRLVWDYPYQTAERLEVYTDTDWAGCVRTRKNTSGGCLMLGRHVIKCWSATQASLALSSGEAEVYGVVKGCGVGLGQRALFKDVGIDLPVRVWTDSTAAIGICGRQGLGKLRNLACRSLWVQQKVRSGEIELRKVLGTANPANLFTKHLESRAKVDQLLGLFGCRFVDGRSAAAPKLRREAVAALCQQSEKESHQPAHDLRELPHQLSPEEVDRLFPLTPKVPAPLGEPDEQLDIEMFEPGLLPATQRPGTPTRVLVPSSNAAAREPSELMDASACLVCLPTCSYGSGRPASRGQTGALLGSGRPASARVRGSPNHGGQGHTPCFCLVYEGGQPRFCDTANTENPASALVPTEGGGLSCPQAGGFTVVTPDGRRPIDTSTTLDQCGSMMFPWQSMMRLPNLAIAPGSIMTSRKSSSE